jgi:hypothetical protein
MHNKNIQAEFAERAGIILETEGNVIGLAVGGSWLTDEIDEFSDLDLILVTKEKISGDKETMIGYAKRLGNFLSGFTGDHVGEPRLLICLYDSPILHVDIKFLTLGEFHSRVETPVILLDRDNQLSDVIRNSTSQFPHPDYQWIEDRFWIWVHYVLLKIGRGEYLEAFDCFGFLRMKVFGPLLHIKNGNLPRGVRRVETELKNEDMDFLKRTIPQYDKQSLLHSLRNSVSLYRELRVSLFDQKVQLEEATEQRVIKYFDHIENRK